MASASDSQELYGAIFRTVTKHLPDEPMVKRTDLVMAIYQDFHKWATGESDEAHGVDADAVTVEIDTMEWVPFSEAPPGEYI